jgi:N-acyl-D-amino-acid deacylase
MLDLVIRGVRILDGSGGPEREGDVAVQGDRIVEVGARVEPGVAVEEVDATGLAVMPGIVDLHTHSDVSILSDPGCVSAIGQGVTTQVVGLCGFSAAPVSAETLPGMIDEEPVFAFPDVAWDWRTMGEYVAALGRARPATNVVSLLGHTTLRRYVMGTEDRPPTQRELERMKDILGSCFDEGARGFSTGLTYAPGMFAGDDEIVALATVAARAGLPYHTHMRYGWAGGVRASVAESIEHATRAGVELNISHLYPRPTESLDEPLRYIEMIEAARAGGTPVTFDMTVFPRGGGAWLQIVPKWARDGGLRATIARIQDPTTRVRLSDEIRANPEWSADFDDCLIVKINRPENAGLVGRSIGQLARERNRDPLDTALDLVVEDGQFWVAPTIKLQVHLDTLMRHPLCVPESDGMAQHPVRHRDLGIMPKTFGSFPLVLGSYVRDRGVLTLPEAVRRITREPASRVGLHDRGRLEPGAAADLLLFDPATIANRATEEGDPAAAPAGISRVMVNGRWALVGDVHSEERYGQAL